MTPQDTQLLSAIASVVSAWASVAGVIGGLLGALVGAGASLTVSRRQFRADVLSRNGQEWINTLRDTVAELLSLVAWGPNDWRKTSTEPFAERMERMSFLQWKLTLLLNPKEYDHNELASQVALALVVCAKSFVGRIQNLERTSFKGHRKRWQSKRRRS